MLNYCETTSVQVNHSNKLVFWCRGTRNGVTRGFAEHKDQPGDVRSLMPRSRTTSHTMVIVDHEKDQI